MEGIDPSFSPQQGDIIVAGNNFGCGSSREQAVLAPRKYANIGCVVAKSFGRIFFRNDLINVGLPIIEGDIVDFVNTGDEIEVDISEGTIKIGNKIRAQSYHHFCSRYLRMMA